MCTGAFLAAGPVGALGSGVAVFGATGAGVDRGAGGVLFTGGGATLSCDVTAFCGTGNDRGVGVELALGGAAPVLRADVRGVTGAVFVPTILDRATVVLLMIGADRELLLATTFSSFCRFWAIARACRTCA